MEALGGTISQGKGHHLQLCSIEVLLQFRRRRRIIAQVPLLLLLALHRSRRGRESQSVAGIVVVITIIARDAHVCE